MKSIYKIVLSASMGIAMVGCGSSGSSNNSPQLETQDGAFISQFCQQNPQDTDCQREAFCRANPTSQSCSPSTQCLDNRNQQCARRIGDAVQRGFNPDYSYNPGSTAAHCCPAGGVPTYVDGAYVCATTVGQKRSSTLGTFRIVFKENRKGKIKSRASAEIVGYDQHDSVTNYTNVGGRHCYPSVRVNSYTTPGTGYTQPAGYQDDGYTEPAYQGDSYQNDAYQDPGYNGGYQNDGYQDQTY